MRQTTIEQELTNHQKISYKISGVSMLPLLRQNRDLVYIVSKENYDYGISDVVLYKRGEQLVLHRIVAKNGSKYEIIGDNQYIPETVFEDQIIGVMTAFLRNGKEILIDDTEYQKYTKEVMNMSMLRRRCLAYIRRLI